VNILLKEGAEVNVREDLFGSTALMNAVLSGDLDTVKVLLDKNADINVKDKDGKTALMLAESEDNIEIMKLFNETEDTR
jgi:serine/threonine-protein phosphatase 6 regulatory ankyrin repeat subunit B